MMKASVKAKYETDKAAATGAATIAFNAGDFKLRASMTDATVVNGPSLNGLALAVEKPGSFIFDYNVPKKDFRFQFMNSIRVLEKPLNLNYIHFRGDNRTILDGTLVFDSANKVSANHVLGSRVSHKVYRDDVCRATYQTTSKNLGFEWSRSSKLNGSFKVAASLCLADELKMPKLTAESSWDFDI
ncbi:outer envelope pore protein 24B, chloroplastic-like isoform X2 [Nicotiana tabacum]|uniref:Outer envelope pore protein 24B, chloroplastic-like isoform X2 n=1 Tax=Nicotiana tabacum TaxID=4097 RepID=A0A1S3ZQ39_TOBAC|nr:PREDICTED: outer envelope pore protein 24B, chloroplastic-like isoform X2 [Nicotiana tabacum]